jgi:predicted nucleotidyltransferase
VSRILAELKSYLQSLYGERLSQVILYGSQAREDAVSGSNIDVLVVLRGPVNPLAESDRLIDRIVEWNLDDQELVSCLFMDEDRFLTRNGPLLRNIRREGISL